MTWPGPPSRIARMSSIRGPGQKLPRASTIRVTSGEASVAIMGWRSFLDEQRGVGLGHDLDGRGRAGGLAHLVDEVVPLQAEHVHRHLARDELDPHGGRGLGELTRTGHAVLLAEAAHHPGAHAEEVHLAELQV